MRRLEALAVGVCLAIGVLVALLPDLHPAVRITLVLPLVVFLPGYTVARALMPNGRLGPVESLTMGLGLSLSILALAGIALHLTPAGITASTWLALLVSITATASVIWILRARRAAKRLDIAVETAEPAPRRRVERLPSLIQAAAFGMALVIVVASFAVAIAGVNAQPRPGFVQLWLLPTSDPAVVTVGVRNEESRPISVRIRLTRGSSMEAEWSDIALNNDATWTTTVAVPEFPTGPTPLQASLSFMESADVVYRYVTLWPAST